jgi:hypothetical protein
MDVRIQISVAHTRHDELCGLVVRLISDGSNLPHPFTTIARASPPILFNVSTCSWK